MKNLLWAAGAVIVAVLLMLGINAIQHPRSLGAVTSPPTVLDYLQITQAIGYLTSGIAAPANDTIVRSALNTASSTLCAIQNPFNATSTIAEAFINVTTGTSSAAQIIIASSSTPYATSSPLMVATLASGQMGQISNPGIATSTGLGVSVGPTGYVVIGIGSGGSVNYGYTYGGLCAARFVAAN